MASLSRVRLAVWKTVGNRDGAAAMVPRRELTDEGEHDGGRYRF